MHMKTTHLNLRAAMVSLLMFLVFLGAWQLSATAPSVAGAAKAGMIGMSKALAQELAARGVTVNCVAPGFIATAMTDALNAQQRERLLQSIPAGRLGQAGDVAAAVVYLASEEAAYVTGQTLHVNGGMAMI